MLISLIIPKQQPIIQPRETYIKKLLNTIFVFALVVTVSPSFVGNLTVKGDMVSTLHCELQRQIIAGNAMKILTLSPVGSVYGTRYKGVFQSDWSGAH